MDSIVVIGASQGGVHALRKLVAELPLGFPAPVMIVLHIGAGQSVLPSLLNEVGPLHATHARDGERIRPGRIYVAPPDRHLMVVDGEMELSLGPRENWARPAVDPLFRSAAEVFGAGAIGVLLTGRLNDGVAGLYEIKRRGGTVIVQDPDEAEAPSMPQSALDNVEVDHRWPVAEIGRRLTGLVKELETRSTPGIVPILTEPGLQHAVAQTCPDCGGAMREERLGPLTRFRCHIGHVMTAEVLAVAQLDTLQRELASAFRALNERADLCAEMAAKAGARGEAASRRRWLEAETQARERETAMRRLAEVEWLNPENAAVDPVDDAAA
jgi:two-component system chemotaxis response regulator CheB